MLCKCRWIVLYTVHVTAFCLGEGRFPDTVYYDNTIITSRYMQLHLSLSFSDSALELQVVHLNFCCLLLFCYC